MVGKLFTKIFGSRNERQVKRLQKTVTVINGHEESMLALDDTGLRAKTAEFRKRLEAGETIDELLPEAFAAVRETGRRVLNMRHFDVQMIGGIVLHRGKIAEMRTGEGKTLVATLSAYLNALSGDGVHIVTVNDYLAQRDAEWMGKIYGFLGMDTGVIVANLSHRERQAAYAADITYGTNNEFGFDYLRDNMAFTSGERVQRGLNFAIVDEVDSILIDEARTPLIISGPTDDNSTLYQRINKLIPGLEKQERMAEKDEEELPGDYAVDEKAKQVYLSEAGHEHIEELLMQAGILTKGTSLYDSNNLVIMHHVNAALRAHALFEADVDYIVKDGQIVIVDEFTGRTMEGRRWSEGLHQAVEAKEGVGIQNENQTMASITFQNYFRLYGKLSGMTGTADTEAYEFQQIYGLEVMVIPTHMPMVRDDRGDLVYLSAQEKYDAIIADIKDCRKQGQPVLVGTVSIENSELLSKQLGEEKIPHQVLNAKFHEHEAQIIIQAGRPGTVTIATNMAGRGTDIVLGGNVEAEIRNMGDTSEAHRQKLRDAWKILHDEVLKSGGLHIIGTERHESRRVDNQLRGRSGRQGDPGSSRFYLSLQDSLMRIFASERVSSMMQKFGMEKGEAIEHPWVTRAIENAQRKVEGHNFDIRKQLLEYDDVANDQRKVIYEQRNELMEAENVENTIDVIRHDVLNELIDNYIAPNSPDEMWDVPGLEKALHQEFFIEQPVGQWLKDDHDLHEQTLRQKVEDGIKEEYSRQKEQAGVDTVRDFEKGAMLQILDQHWKEHLAAMDHLRQGIGLRGYAQKNPKQEYKREAFERFSLLLDRFKRTVIQGISAELSKVAERIDADLQALEERQRQTSPLQYQHASVNGMGEGEEEEGAAAPPPKAPFVRQTPKVGRNAPCPCGSGKKYKHCHGQLR
ncbi:MAG: preprotein translocase subunit SecA [Gammaproteobacteria bacterium]|nr:preprotein translocase subunit SecA [Gammaproteobacteria bacterium]